MTARSGLGFVFDDHGRVPVCWRQTDGVEGPGFQRQGDDHDYRTNFDLIRHPCFGILCSQGLYANP
jgi:hypothetical protein